MSLNSYNNSPIYNISIRYNGELVKFNLAKELKFRNETINLDLKRQATKYGFCLLVHKGLVTEFERLKVQRKRVYGKLFFKAKAETLNNRPLSDDLCKCWVEKHDDYKEISLKCIVAKDNADKLFSCIRAFEQRMSLMQTISANARKETS